MLWVKALHIIAVVCWFAALFYLPRLYVYHAQANAAGDRAGSERFKIMERKLYRGIMTPSMVAVLLLGIGLLASNWHYYFSQGWMHAKLLLVAFLIIYHHICLVHLKRFATDTNTKSEKYFRIFNEIPVVLLIGIVILVVVRPF